MSIWLHGILPLYRVVELDGVRIKVQLWGTSGDRGRIPVLCANSHGIMIMYSVQDESSFESAKYWMDEVKRVGRSGVKVVLVGNKSDEHEKKVVSYARAREFADKHDIPLFEVSAKDGTNVELAVLTELASIAPEQMVIAAVPVFSSTIIDP